MEAMRKDLIVSEEGGVSDTGGQVVQNAIESDDKVKRMVVKVASSSDWWNELMDGLIDDELGRSGSWIGIGWNGGVLVGTAEGKVK